MNTQNEFLQGEFWILSWNASVQRALRYGKNKSSAEHSAFRDYIIKHCDEVIIPRYLNTQSEAQHLDNIRELFKVASSYPDEELLARPYNIGITQKLLNLQLKYLWCAGFIGMPPHCPVDRIILNYTKLKNKMNWTQITSISEYQEAIEAIREVSESRPLAIWELEIYDRKMANQHMDFTMKTPVD